MFNDVQGSGQFGCGVGFDFVCCLVAKEPKVVENLYKPWCNDSFSRKAVNLLIQVPRQQLIFADRLQHGPQTDAGENIQIVRQCGMGLGIRENKTELSGLEKDHETNSHGSRVCRCSGIARTN
jgi:hypothetical protein